MIILLGAVAIDLELFRGATVISLTANSYRRIDPGQFDRKNARPPKVSIGLLNKFVMIGPCDKSQRDASLGILHETFFMLNFFMNSSPAANEEN